MEPSLKIRNRFTTHQSQPTSDEATPAEKKKAGIWHKKNTVDEYIAKDRISGICSNQDDILGTYLLAPGAFLVTVTMGVLATYLIQSSIKDYQNGRAYHTTESQIICPILIGIAAGATALGLVFRKISKLENTKSYYNSFDKEIVAAPKMLKSRNEIVYFLKLFGAKKITDHYNDKATVLIVNDDVEKKNIQTNKNQKISILTVKQIDKMINDFTN